MDSSNPVQFSKNGVNQLVKLRIVNIQSSTENRMTRKVWREVSILTPKLKKKPVVLKRKKMHLKYTPIIILCDAHFKQVMSALK